MTKCWHKFCYDKIFKQKIYKNETKNITIPPDQAYGPKIPEAIQEIDASQFAGIPDMEVGGLVQGNGPQGPFLAKVANITDTHVTLDLNHPLAGETLNFEIEMVANNV